MVKLIPYFCFFIFHFALKKTLVANFYSFQIASEKDSAGKVKSIPILDGRVLADDDNLTVRIVHGTQIRPVFEAIAYDSLEPLTCLVRQLPVAKSQQTTTAGSSNLVVSVSTFLAPITFERKC